VRLFEAALDRVKSANFRCRSPPHRGDASANRAVRRSFRRHGVMDPGICPDGSSQSAHAKALTALSSVQLLKAGPKPPGPVAQRDVSRASSSVTCCGPVAVARKLLIDRPLEPRIPRSTSAAWIGTPMTNFVLP
jgi:hypothetical protein